ncbi:MAG: DUF1579 domain-containing protein [Rhizobiales bacterium]|nr:DUF1579 domain-containing protein [Hyphomicrobiales bacterium]
MPSGFRKDRPVSQPANSDFDFEFGHWNVRHRRLKERLVCSEEWEEFSGTTHARPILGGNGNIEDNEIQFPGGTYRAVALRSLDGATGQWAIWWLDGRHPHTLDVPVVGGFSGDVGTFLARDMLRGKPIIVRFQWFRLGPDQARWEQAFSPDDGESWETNWVMHFERTGA